MGGLSGAALAGIFVAVFALVLATLVICARNAKCRRRWKTPTKHTDDSEGGKGSASSFSENTVAVDVVGGRPHVWVVEDSASTLSSHASC